MPSLQAKVFVRLLDWAPTETQGVVKLNLEWRMLYGDQGGSKFMYVSDVVVNRERLVRDAIDALVVMLNERFPNENLRDREVLLWGS